MILVIGGQGAGKRHYVREMGFSEGDMALAVLDERPVLVDLHVLLKGHTEVEEEVFEALAQKAVVICNEVGCGLVPMDAADRAWRDLVGRTCTRLAKRAERVVRVCCGIPIYLKETAQDTTP